MWERPAFVYIDSVRANLLRQRRHTAVFGLLCLAGSWIHAPEVVFAESLTIRFFDRAEATAWTISDETSAPDSLLQDIPVRRDPNCPKQFRCFLLPESKHSTGAASFVFDSPSGRLYTRQKSSDPPERYRLWADFAPDGDRQNQPKIFFGDFDGDGSIDAVVKGGRFSSGKIALSRGTTAVEDDFVLPFPIERSAAAVHALDINADGLTDFLDLEGGRARRAINTPPPAGAEPFVLAVFEALPPPAGGFAPAGILVVLRLGTAESPLTVSDLAPGNYQLLFEFDAGVTGISSRFYRRYATISPGAHETISLGIESPKRHGGKLPLGRAFDDSVVQPIRPKVCVGYLPVVEDPKLGYGKWNHIAGVCPPGYAYYSISEGNSRGPACSWGFAQCCPLPAEDILLEKQVWVQDECPADAVVTGFRNTNPISCDQWIRCSFINTDRYSLAAPVAGTYWGAGLTMRGQHDYLAQAEIPEAIRYGVTRWDFHRLMLDGCIGRPFGSLLTRKGGSKCSESAFRELRFTADSSPVPMFPDCAAIEDIFSGNSGCFSR